MKLKLIIINMTKVGIKMSPQELCTVTNDKTVSVSVCFANGHNKLAIGSEIIVPTRASR